MSLKWDNTNKGLIKIESKEDMEKRGLPSPDRADAVMMSRRRAAYIPTPTEVGAQDFSDLTSDLLGRPL
jgi:phage terminase large subunit